MGLLGKRPTNANQQGKVETSLDKLIWRRYAACTLWAFEVSWTLKRAKPVEW